MFDPPVMRGIYHFLSVDKPCLNAVQRISLLMLYENSSLDATLAAAAGEDTALLQELRGAFAESLERQIDLLKRARCDGNWNIAAMRLKGLAASFHADALILLANEACEAAPGEPTVVRKIEAYYRDFVGSTD
jgi:HPt (histidine-containing phosphotransfer) domain-containing protein